MSQLTPEAEAAIEAAAVEILHEGRPLEGSFALRFKSIIRRHLAPLLDGPRAEEGPIVIGDGKVRAVIVKGSGGGSGVVCCRQFGLQWVYIPLPLVPRVADALLAVSRAQQPVAGLGGVPGAKVSTD